MGAEIGDHAAFSRNENPRQGYVEITGLAWSGGGAISKVEVSTDGGKSWKEAKLQAPVIPKAHTRFNFDWDWDGQEAVISRVARMKRVTFSRRARSCIKHWGIAERGREKPARAIHFNAMQPWRVARDGSIHDAMFA